MKIRFRLILSFFVIIGLAFYFFLDFLLNDIRPRYLEALEESINDTAHVMASFLEERIQQMDKKQNTLNSDQALSQAIPFLHQAFFHAKQRRFQAQVYILNKKKVEMEFYVTDKKGQVIYDSMGRYQGQDFSRWNDVYLTLRGQYGARSSLLDENNPGSGALFVAAPVRRQGRLIGVLTVIKPKKVWAFSFKWQARKFFMRVWQFWHY